MADVAAVRGIWFKGESLRDVVAPPYDVIGPKDREELVKRSPHNIVRIDLPDGEGDTRYEHAKSLLAAWQKEGVLVRDDVPSMLRYEQTFLPPDGGAPITRRGFFALVRAEAYEKRVVLPHERTLSGPKEDRYKLFCATETALSPVFLLYDDKSGDVADALRNSEPESEMQTHDGIHHRFARVTDKASIARVRAALKNSSLLIADGHHRYETTLRYGKSVDEARAKAGLPPAPDGAHHFVLAFLADSNDKGLLVFPTHRVIHGLSSFDANAMLSKVSDLFDASDVASSDPKVLAQKLEESGKKTPSLMVVLGGGRSVLLSLKTGVDVNAHPVLSTRPPVLRRTDVVLLHAGILESVLGITLEQQALQTNIQYFKKARDAVDAVQSGQGQVGFLMNGTPVADVRRSCEAGEVMPQKSTFFYPKVPTGLLLHRLDPNERVEF